MGNRYLSLGRRKPKKKQWSLLKKVLGSKQEALKYTDLKSELLREQSKSFQEVLRLSPREFDEKIDTFPEEKQELLRRELFKIYKEEYLNLLQRHSEERKDFEEESRTGYEKMKIELENEMEKVRNRYKKYEEKLNEEIKLLSSYKEDYSLKLVAYVLKDKKLPYQKEGRAPVRKESISLKIAENIQKLNALDRSMAEEMKLISNRYNSFQKMLNEYYEKKREKILTTQCLERQQVLANLRVGIGFFDQSTKLPEPSVLWGSIKSWRERFQAGLARP